VKVVTVPLHNYTGALIGLPYNVEAGACVVRAASGSAPRTMAKQHAIQHVYQLLDDAGLAPVRALELRVRVWPMR
jgi:hypothetical protein